MSFSLKAFADGIRRRPLLSAVLRLLLAAGTVAVCFLMLEASLATQLSHLASMRIRVIALNLGTISVFLTFLLLLCRRVWLSCAITAFVSGVVAIINHYVIFLHGQPLSFLVLKNFRTAMNVLGAYSLPIHNSVLATAAAMVFVLLSCLIVRRCAAELSGRWMWIRSAVLLVCSLCVLYFGYFSTEPVKPRKTISWLWSPAYTQYGYAACTLETLLQSFQAVSKPEGYTDAALDAAADAALDAADGASAGTQTPDVILILNETFYDLRMLTDLQTDVPYLSHIESMDDLLTGYAVVPSAAGGTNSSEYELLTGNSLQLLPGVTPFNILDLNDACSIVSVLEQLGYYSIGCHPETPENYNRKYGYTALGFDRVFFKEDFLGKERPPGRNFFSDESVYREMLGWYEESPADQPRFLYCLTIQNHGAWENGPSEHDTVHVLDDYGDRTDDLNEFLTCISRSDEAFYGLTEYFAAQERPVILCMVGDHSPSIDTAVADPTLSEEELSLRRRSVPLLIWANFPLPETELGTMSLNYVVPTLLELAGIQMPPYYSYMTELREQVPVLTSIDRYVTADGSVHSYSDTTPFTEAINSYFYLEYNNLSRQPRQELFRVTPD